jgi:hypothetical protein
MAGIMDLLIGCAGQGGGGGYGGTLGAMNWSNIFDTGAGLTNAQTITGITGSVSIGATLTGTGSLFTTLGHTPFPGTKSFNNGDVVTWEVQNFTTATASGTVTVTNQTAGGTTIDTFTYTVLRDT